MAGTGPTKSSDDIYKTFPAPETLTGTKQWITGSSTSRNESLQNVLRAHYTRINNVKTVKPNVTSLIIPAKHRRLNPTDYERMRRSHCKSQPLLISPPTPMPQLTLPTAVTPEESKSVRFKLHDEGKYSTRTLSDGQFLGASSRFSPSKQDDLAGIKETCRLTRSGVRRDKRIAGVKRRRFMRGLKQCSVAVERALKVDVHGYIPKELQEYKRRKAEERAAKGLTLRKPPPIYLRKEVVFEYRRDLLHKALKHNIDKDMRYIYTLGSCSAANT